MSIKFFSDALFLFIQFFVDCTEFTDYVMTLNMRYDYAACAAYAAVIAEILEAEGKTPSKNTYMLERKQAYPRRTAYHRELRAYGMVDGK